MPTGPAEHGRQVVLQALRVAAFLAALAGKGLYRAHADQGFVNDHVAVGQTVLGGSRTAANGPAEEERHDDQGRHGGEHHQRQAAGNQGAQGHAADQDGYLPRGLRPDHHERLLDLRQVAGQAAVQLADATLHVERQRQADQAAKGVAAQIGQGALAHEAEPIGLQKRAKRLHAKNGDQGRCRQVHGRHLARNGRINHSAGHVGKREG